MLMEVVQFRDWRPRGVEGGAIDFAVAVVKSVIIRMAF